MARSVRSPTALATSEVEHVLATQTLIQKKAKNMRVTVDGALGNGVTAKDIILAIIGEIGTAGGTGHVIEYAGEAIEALSMEGRMTVCNMSIEGGARAGMIAPDDKTYAYLEGCPRSPRARPGTWRGSIGKRCTPTTVRRSTPRCGWLRPACRRSSPGAQAPQDVVSITGVVPDPGAIADEAKRAAVERALAYMGLEAGTKITDIPLDVIWIGSCTNGRIEDLRAVAKIVDGKRVAESLDYAMIVPAQAS